MFTQTSSNFVKAWNGLRKNTKLHIEQCLVHKKGYPLILDWGDTWCFSEVIICSWKSFLKSFSRKFCTQKASRFLISSLARVILGPFMPTLHTKSARKLDLISCNKYKNCFSLLTNQFRCKVLQRIYCETRDLPGVALVITFFTALYTKKKLNFWTNAPFRKFYNTIVKTSQQWLKINGKNAFGCPLRLGLYLKVECMNQSETNYSRTAES